jgi:hypothetical protein
MEPGATSGPDTERNDSATFDQTGGMPTGLETETDVLKIEPVPESRLGSLEPGRDADDHPA